MASGLLSCGTAQGIEGTPLPNQVNLCPTTTATNKDPSEKDQAASQRMNPLQGRPTVALNRVPSTQQQATNQQLKHPPPVHKTARKHLNKLRALGFNSFEETGVPYWETQRPNEIWSEFSGRRQRECQMMEEFLTKAGTAAHQKIHQEATTPSNTINRAPAITATSPIVDLTSSAMDTDEEANGNREALNDSQRRNAKLLKLAEKMRSQMQEKGIASIEQQTTQPSQGLPTITAPNINFGTQHSTPTFSATKRPASSKSGDQVTDKRHKVQVNDKEERPRPAPLSESVRNLQKDLDRERNQRKKLEGRVTELSNQVTALVQSINALTQELREQRNSCSPRAATSTAPESSQNSIKKAVEDIMAPLLKDLGKPTAETNKIPKQRHPPAPQQQQNSSRKSPPAAQKCPQTKGRSQNAASTSKDGYSDQQPTYSQIVGTGPAATHTRKVLASSVKQKQQPATGTQSQEPTPEDTTADSFQKTRSQRRREARTRAKQVQKGTGENKRKEHRPRLPRTSRENPAAVLLLPNSSTPNVLQKLQNMREADPRELGVKRHIPFASGALLVTCETQEQANKLRAISSQAGIAEKQRSHRKPEFRVHLIPSNATPAQVKADLAKRLGELEMDVQLLPYQTAKFGQQQFAVIQTNLAGLEKVKRLKSIRIGWAVCRVTTHIHIKRCPKCDLLGHSQHKCTTMVEEGAEELAAGTCKDCTHYNSRQKKASAETGIKHHLRPVNHKTGSSTCPTLFALRKKALPSRSQGGQTTSPMQQ